jgi:hypothetical protein
MGQASLDEYAILVTMTFIDILVNSFRFLLFILFLPFAPLMTAVARYFGKSVLDVQEGRDYEIKDWRLLPRLAAYGDLGGVEAYIDGWWECEDSQALAVKLLSWKWIKPLYRISPYRFLTYLRWGLLNLQTRNGALYSAKHQYSYSGCKIKFYTSRWIPIIPCLLMMKQWTTFSKHLLESMPFTQLRITEQEQQIWTMLSEQNSKSFQRSCN